MPYRRRGSTSTYYRRRRPRRRTMWARVGYSIGTIADTAIGVADLLYWLKNPQVMTSTGRMPGAVEVGTPQALTTGQWPTQPFTGATILRTRGRIIATSTAATPQSIYYGIRTGDGNLGTAATGTNPVLGGPVDVDPANNIGANTADWMMWDRLDPITPFSYNPQATTNGATIWPFDVRAKRKLEDWGDSLYLFISPTGGNVVNYEIIASTLIALP